MNRLLVKVKGIRVVAALALAVGPFVSPQRYDTGPAHQLLPVSSVYTNASAADRSAQVDALLTSRFQAEGPGVAVLVLEGSTVLHKKGYGLADLQTRTSITAATAFDLASVSKQFNAMAVMILAERGRLAYDDPLSKFFPQFPAYARKITVRHLLHHTSGLPDYSRLFAQGGKVDPTSSLRKERAFEPTSRDTLQLLARQKQLRFAPGEKWEYSNSGYVLLAQIVEKVSGVTYSRFLKENIFRPIGMIDTLVYDETRPKVKNRARSYSRRGNHYKDIDYNALNLIYGDGNVNSTLEDMCKWYGALSTEKLVKASTLQQAFTSGSLKNGAGIDYGFGWFVGESLGLRRLFHSGSWVGFRNLVVHYPEQRFTVLLLSNLAQFAFSDRSDVAYQIAKIYLGRKMTLPVAVQVAPVILIGYAGKYAPKTGPTLEVAFENNRLQVRSPDRKAENLVPESEAKFFVEGLEDDRFTFNRDARAHVTGLTRRQFLHSSAGLGYTIARRLP